MATVSERLRNIIVEQLGVEESEVVPSASFTEDLNADSLDLVELIKIFLDLQSTKFCLIIRYQQRPL